MSESETAVENIYCVEGLLSAVSPADTAAFKRVMRRLRLLSSDKKEPWNTGSFGCWIHLRNHLSGWLCLTEPRTDCVCSCRLAQQGHAVPY